MRYIAGTHRHVLVVGQLVFKVPKLGLFDYFSLVSQDIRYRRIFWLKWRRFFESISEGFWENFREAQCYLYTKHRLLSRLYAPFLLVNVYHLETGVGDFDIDGEELITSALKFGDKEFLKRLRLCSHTFDNRCNFANSSGGVKIIDYGEKGIEVLLKGYGDEIERFLISVSRK